MGFGAHGDGRQIGGHGHGRAAAGAQRVKGAVGVARLPAQHAEAVGHAGVHLVGPLGEVGLAQDDGAGVAQLCDQEGITARLPVAQGLGAGRGVQAVAGGDVVLEQHGDAVHGPAHRAPPARSASSWRAISSASGFSSMTELSLSTS